VIALYFLFCSGVRFWDQTFLIGPSISDISHATSPWRKWRGYWPWKKITGQIL
jgi:hypothetical protein